MSFGFGARCSYKNNRPQTPHPDTWKTIHNFNFYKLYIIFVCALCADGWGGSEKFAFFMNLLWFIIFFSEKYFSN